MTTHAPMARVPFAPLDNPRLQHLASAKNHQNGISAQKPTLDGKPDIVSSKCAQKRAFEPATFDDYDSENVDPAVFLSPSKKTKSDAFTFSLMSAKSMPPPAVPSRFTTPIKANMSSPRAPMTAPAGRSPKRKIAGINKNRRTSAPFTRIDPPSASRGSSLPFSLDAALNGTFSTPKSAGATIAESMPKGWFFEIYEDTQEEEASNLMEHSTLTLDLSSDEESEKKVRDDRGKENTPPEDYDQPTASRAVGEVPRQIRKTEMVRKKVFVDEMDDGEREPLSDLEREAFIPEGLSRESFVVVDGVEEGKKEESVEAEKPDVSKTKEKLDVSKLFAIDVAEKKRPAVPTSDPVAGQHGVKGEIVVWEDNSVDAPATEHSVETQAGNATKDGSPKEIEVFDENTAPAVL